MDKREKQPKKRWRPLPLRGTRLGPVLQALLTLLLLGGGRLVLRMQGDDAEQQEKENIFKTSHGR